MTLPSAANATLAYSLLISTSTERRSWLKNRPRKAKDRQETSMGTSLPPSCRAAPAQLCLARGSRAGRTTQKGGTSRPCRTLGLCPVLPGLSIHPAMAPRNHIRHWEEGRVVIAVAKRPSHHPALSLLELPSYGGRSREHRAAADPASPPHDGAHHHTAPVLPGRGFCQGSSQRPRGWGRCGRGAELWESPPAVSTRATKEPPEDEDFWVAACLGWPRVMAKSRGAARPRCHSQPLPLPRLSYRWQTRLYSLLHYTHRNHHFLPVILKLRFGSEQTPRVLKAPDKKSVSL